MTDNTARDGLLPCPFCGGTVASYQHHSAHNGIENRAVRCEVCGACCGPSASDIAAQFNWNTRAAIAALAGKDGA